MKIVFTGGSGRFGKIFKEKTKLKNVLYPKRYQLDITNLKSIQKYLKKHKPKVLVHAAGLSRPMELHEKNIGKSIKTNIIGTCNVVIACSELKIKIVYLSTCYVYPGVKGNYKEDYPLLPYNNYAWSKLGGESALNMYNNSLVIRLCMTEKPFIHKYAFKDMITNFMFHEDFVKIFPKLIHKKGILNVGGKTLSPYKFAKKYNKKVVGVNSFKILKKKFL
tara:strand:- start:7927 stop:8586 length:660 start_codon:yes stop_codon:yes gene_type:complete